MPDRGDLLELWSYTDQCMCKVVQVVHCGSALAEGSGVEAFVDGGWWEAEMLTAADVDGALGGAGTVTVRAGGQEHAVRATDVRLRVRWTGGNASLSDATAWEVSAASSLPTGMQCQLCFCVRTKLWLCNKRKLHTEWMVCRMTCSIV